MGAVKYIPPAERDKVMWEQIEFLLIHRMTCQVRDASRCEDCARHAGLERVMLSPFRD